MLEPFNDHSDSGWFLLDQLIADLLVGHRCCVPRASIADHWAIWSIFLCHPFHYIVLGLEPPHPLSHTYTLYVYQLSQRSAPWSSAHMFFHTQCIPWVSVGCSGQCPCHWQWTCAMSGPHIACVSARIWISPFTFSPVPTLSVSPSVLFLIGGVWQVRAGTWVIPFLLFLWVFFSLFLWPCVVVWSVLNDNSLVDTPWVFSGKYVLSVSLKGGSKGEGGSPLSCPKGGSHLPLLPPLRSSLPV